MNASMLVSLLRDNGPMTGKELKAAAASMGPVNSLCPDELALWRLCMKTDGITAITAGRRYLRLDKGVEGYARLSPSIIREFYGYTVIGTTGQHAAIIRRIKQINDEIQAISRKKYSVAEETIRKLVENRGDADLIKTHTCFIIAGDVAYGMSHTEPRPEPSTGQMVNGSDLDIIAVTEGLPEHITKSLEQSIYDRKYYLLKNPSYREELDFVVKDIAKAEEQMQFDTFRHMVASKIMDEGLYLYGSNAIFNRLKSMLAAKGVPQKLAVLVNQAGSGRIAAVKYLLSDPGILQPGEYMKLFCTNEEREEFD